jgi:hypothetical protein
MMLGMAVENIIVPIISGWIHEYIDTWIHGNMDRWIDGYMDT